MKAEQGPASRRASLFGWLTEGLAAIGSIWIIFLMVLINCDVISRYFFNKPIVGTVEIVSMSIVGIIYLQLGSSLRHERFISSDAILGRVLISYPRFGYAVQCFHHVVGAILVGLIVYFCLPETINTWQQSEYVGTEGVFILYVWPIFAIVTIGSAITAVQFMLHALRDIQIAAGLKMPPLRSSEEDEAAVI